MADSSSAMRARSLRARGPSVPTRGYESHGGRLDDGAGFEDVGQRDVAGLEDQCGRACREPLIGSVDDDATLHSAHHGDEPFGLQDAERFSQRRSGHTEPLDEIRLVTEGVAFVQFPEDDEAPQLVGDLLGFLPGLRATRATGWLLGSFSWPSALHAVADADG